MFSKDYIICQVFEALIIDPITGSIEAKDCLESGDLDISQEAKDVIAGKAGSTITQIAGKRQIVIKFSEPVFNLQSLSNQLGSICKSGAVTAYAMPKSYKVGTGKRITLEHTPVEGTLVFEKSTISGTVTADSKDVTLTGADVGEEVRVKTYQYLTPSTTQTIEIYADKFATAKKLVLETEVFDKEGALVGFLQLDFPRVKSNGAISMQTKTEKEAVSSAFEFTVLAEHEKQGTIKFIPIENSSEAYSIVGDNTIVSEKTKVK